LWDVRTGQPAGPALRHDGPVAAAAFSPDGSSVLTGSPDRNGRLWDVATGKLLLTLPCAGAVHVVAFSPDSQTVLTGIQDRTARLWSVATGKPIGMPLQHEGEVMDARFSADGQTVLTAATDRKGTRSAHRGFTMCQI